MVSGSSAGVGEVGSSPSDWEGGSVSCGLVPLHTDVSLQEMHGREGWEGVYHLD